MDFDCLFSSQMGLTCQMGQNVIASVVLLAKSSIANMASKRPNAAVNELMRFQVARSGKRLIAQITLVRFVLVVRHTMVIEIARGRKSLAAKSALMRLFSAVNSSVSIEAGRR